MMFRNILAVVGAIFVVSIAVTLITDNSEPVRTQISPNVQRQAELRVFLEECDDGSPGAYEYCVCAFERIEEQHGWDEASRIVDNMSDEDIMDYFWDDFMYCLRQENII